MSNQIQCPHCHAATQTHTGLCMSCHQPLGTTPGLSAQDQAHAHAQAAHQQALKNSGIPFADKIKLPKSPKMRMAFAIGAAVLVAVVGIVGAKLKAKYMPKKGTATYSAIGIDPKRADPDKFIASLEKRANRWRNDAEWWAINLPNVRPDGTIDLTKGTAPPVVTFISPHAVQAQSKTGRKDSIKKFTFGPQRVRYDRKWAATNAWTGVVAPPRPTCTIKNLVSTLGEQGFAGSQTVRVMFDPQFADDLGWTVDSEDPKLKGVYSWDNCAKLRG